MFINQFRTDMPKNQFYQILFLKQLHKYIKKRSLIRSDSEGRKQSIST